MNGMPHMHRASRPIAENSVPDAVHLTCFAEVFVMHKFRIQFSKTARAAYLSHLDTMRTLQRAFARAKIPAKHTEGFNPHAYISIALPLSLGYTSECEYVDFVLLELLSEEEVLTRLNAALPEGFKALRAYEQELKVKEIVGAKFILKFEYDNGYDDDTVSKLTELFSRESIIVMKKSKRGETETDIAPMIYSIDFVPEKDGIRVLAHLAAGNTVSLNPEYLLRAIKKEAGELLPDFVSFHRFSVTCTDGQTFH
ncbi:MAG: DUF2344 domain-containing protein [Ruminococcaceae bacterium]|nr:DUF2344 domain-containing protein [Oscillospiraceae bacterium]